MTVDPKQARAALSRYLPSRLLRAAKSLASDRVVYLAPPGNLKAATRLVRRVEKRPNVAWAFTSKVKGSIIVLIAYRSVDPVIVPNKDGAPYEEEAIIYGISVTCFRKGVAVRKEGAAVGFTPHAIQRWGERDIRFDMKATDADLLDSLDREAAQFITGSQSLGWPIIATKKAGLWLGYMASMINLAGDPCYMVSTFLPAGTLTGNKLLYLNGLGDFSKLEEVVETREGTPEIRQRLVAYAKGKASE